MSRGLEALARIRLDLEETSGRGRLCTRADCDVCESTRIDFALLEEKIENGEKAISLLYELSQLYTRDEESLSSGVPTAAEWEDVFARARDFLTLYFPDDEDHELCDRCGCAGNHSMPDGTPCKHANDGVENCALGECGLCQCCMKG